MDYTLLAKQRTDEGVNASGKKQQVPAGTAVACH
jgi:hypothetical protein